MNTLWIKDGKPFLLSVERDIAEDEVARLQHLFSAMAGGSPVVMQDTEVRHVTDEYPSFGQQTLAEYDPGWPTDLMVFASIAFGLIGLVAGAYFL